MQKNVIYYFINTMAFVAIVGGICAFYELFIRTKNSDGIFVFYSVLAMALIFISFKYFREKKKW